MKVLLLGRHGQLARCLTERRPHLDMVVAGRPEMDLELDGSVRELITEVRPDLVINSAAYTAVDQAEVDEELARRINATGAGEAAGAAAEVGAPIIHVSTDYVFDGSKDSPYREDDITNPATVYGQTKLAGEEMVCAANDKHVIVRTSWLFSPFGRNFVKSMLVAARSNSVLRVVDDQHGSPTSAIDLAGAITLVAKRLLAGSETALGRTYHVAGGGVATWHDVATATMEEAKSLGLPVAEVRPISSSEWPTAAERPRYSALDSTSFAKDFDFVLPDWRLGLKNVVRRLANEELRSDKSASRNARN